MRPFALHTPEKVRRSLAERARELRLARGWRQVTLAERSGVSLGSLRRFESSGRISLDNLLKLALALDQLGDFEALFQRPEARSLAELEAREARPERRRGRL
ncbi:MAG: helix-turn-helix transcriptional regulator [Acidobacteriota bacterium]